MPGNDEIQKNLQKLAEELLHLSNDVEDLSEQLEETVKVMGLLFQRLFDRVEGKSNETW